MRSRWLRLSLMAVSWLLLFGPVAQAQSPPEKTVLPRYQIVASGKAAGGYAAFPDLCRTQSRELLCVFYSGYGHVSTPNKTWPTVPKAGRSSAGPGKVVLQYAGGSTAAAGTARDRGHPS